MTNLFLLSYSCMINMEYCTGKSDDTTNFVYLYTTWTKSSFDNLVFWNPTIFVLTSVLTQLLEADQLEQSRLNSRGPLKSFMQRLNWGAAEQVSGVIWTVSHANIFQSSSRLKTDQKMYNMHNTFPLTTSLCVNYFDMKKDLAAIGQDSWFKRNTLCSNY